MAVYLKNNAVGIDDAINKIITTLNKELNTRFAWNVDIYHRVYKKYDKSNNSIPCVFKSGIDYIDIFCNDRINGEIAFILGNQRNVNKSNIETDCDVVFSLNLNKLCGGSLQREDEKIIMTAMKVLRNYRPKNLNTDIKDILSDYKSDRFIYCDMQPFIVFSFTIRLIYSQKCL